MSAETASAHPPQNASLAISVPAAVRELCDRLARAGFRSWLVGGCVRDLVRGVAVSDWDLATDATPDQVRRVFRRTIPTGIVHGTVTVLFRGTPYEVTTLRGESTYSDGRHPDEVHFVSSIEEDLARRDFTVNAIAYDLLANRLVDPWGGVEDIRRRRIRAVRDPRERFSEDGLRVLRAARLAATLEFDLDPATEAAIPEALDTLRKVSIERVQAEWTKALTKARQPSRAFLILRRTGALAVHAPLVAELAEEAFGRTMVRVDASEPVISVRIAALLVEVRGDRDAWLRAMRFSNEERETVLHLLRARPPPEADLGALDPAAVRRFLQRAGRRHLEQVIGLALADRRARGLSVEPVERLAERARAELRSGVPLTVGDLAVGGGDVMRVLGTGPGRHVGAVLAALLERTIDDPTMNERERLLALIPQVARALSVPPPGEHR
jgi:tRNA nucleotidyltransferase (CCA-adding enzyme)